MGKATMAFNVYGEDQITNTYKAQYLKSSLKSQELKILMILTKFCSDNH